MEVIAGIFGTEPSQSPISLVAFALECCASCGSSWQIVSRGYALALVDDLMKIQRFWLFCSDCVVDGVSQSQIPCLLKLLACIFLLGDKIQHLLKLFHLWVLFWIERIGVAFFGAFPFDALHGLLLQYLGAQILL